MASPFTEQDITDLYAPFPLEDHLTREGNKSKSGKIQWFTYIDRAAVQRRLEKLFPGEWSLDVMETYRAADYIAITLKLTIRGVSRSCNGGQSLKFDKDSLDEDKEKGAWTEAFRRVASVWGIGLYLYEMDYRIWTDGYEAGNWDQQRQRENEAKGKFAEWYSRQYKQSNGKPTPPPLPVLSQPVPPAKMVNVEVHTEAGEITFSEKPVIPTYWPYDYQTLMAHEEIRKLYKESVHRKNVLQLLDRHHAFDKVADVKGAVWKVLMYHRLRANGDSEEDAVAATISAPDPLPDF